MTVISLTEKLSQRASRYGDDSFVLCPCQANEQKPVGFFPCVTHDASGALLYGLTCIACQDVAYVENGRLVGWESEQ